MRSSFRGDMRDDMALRMRRPPTEYVSLLSQSEKEFRSYVDSLETHPAFDRLMSDGVIAKVRLRGKIPREKYEAFMDEQMMDYLTFFGITNHDEWERDFLSAHAMERAPEIAEKYGAPIGDTLRFLRYLSSTGASNISGVLSSGGRSESNERPSMDDTMSGAALVDLTEIIETTRAFVERYDVSEQEFLDLVLSGEATAETLAQHFECSTREAEEVLEAADRVYLAQGYEGAGQMPDRKAQPARPVNSNDEPVAFVRVNEGELAIQFHHDSVYTQRYRIKPGAIKELKKDAPEDARDLLMRARYINQRLSALSRLITQLCELQIEYLESGDVRKLKPLAQAALARDLGEHPSMVSRLIRKKFIETQWGKIELIFLCQSKTDVVARLIAQHPSLTDQEVVTRLRDDYECFIARRTVAYHRGKRLRRNKRRKTAEGEEKTAQSKSKE